MSELRNCPFCGGTKADMGIQSKEGLVYCPECKARAPWGVWNRRATDTSRAAVLNEREECAKVIDDVLLKTAHVLDGADIECLSNLAASIRSRTP